MVTEVLAQRLPQKLRQTLRGWDLVVETCRSLKHRDLPGLVNIQKAIEHDQEIVDLPSYKMVMFIDFLYSYVSLPEGNFNE